MRRDLVSGRVGQAPILRFPLQGPFHSQPNSLLLRRSCSLSWSRSQLPRSHQVSPTYLFHHGIIMIIIVVVIIIATIILLTFTTSQIHSFAPHVTSPTLGPALPSDLPHFLPCHHHHHHQHLHDHHDSRPTLPPPPPPWDQRCRLIFPTTFLVFNIVYWTLLLRTL